MSRTRVVRADREQREAAHRGTSTSIVHPAICYPSMQPSTIHLAIHPSIHPPTIHLPIHLYTHPTLCAGRWGGRWGVDQDRPPRALGAPSKGKECSSKWPLMRGCAHKAISLGRAFPREAGGCSEEEHSR